MRQVKAVPGLCTSQLHHLPITLSTRKATQVNHWHLEGQGWRNDLHWMSIAQLKGCAQAFVPLYHRCQSALQRLHVQPARETKSYRYVIPGTTLHPLIEEP